MQLKPQIQEADSIEAPSPSNEMLDSYNHPGWAELMAMEKGPYYKLAMYVLHKMGINNQRAEDLFQDAAVTMFSKLNNPLFSEYDFDDFSTFVLDRGKNEDPLSKYLTENVFIPILGSSVADWENELRLEKIRDATIEKLNSIVTMVSLRDVVPLESTASDSQETVILSQNSADDGLFKSNRRVLEAKFPKEILCQSDPRTGKFRNWFMTFIRNKARNEKKKAIWVREHHPYSEEYPEEGDSAEGHEAWPHPQLTDMLLSQWEADFFEDIEAGNFDQMLQKGMQGVARRVEPNRFKIFVEALNEVLPHAQIATKFRVSEENVANIKANCLRMLKEEILRQLPPRRTFAGQSEHSESRQIMSALQATFVAANAFLNDAVLITKKPNSSESGQAFSVGIFNNFYLFVETLISAKDDTSIFLLNRFSERAKDALNTYQNDGSNVGPTQTLIMNEINAIIREKPIANNRKRNTSHPLCSNQSLLKDAYNNHIAWVDYCFQEIGQFLEVGRIPKNAPQRGRPAQVERREWGFPDVDEYINLSRHHFEIQFSNGMYLLNDPPSGKTTVSRNGTFVNPIAGRKVVPKIMKNRILESGDLIEAGGIMFYFANAKSKSCN